jgi:hypothetical protein|tara:strand:- start:736 stop:954 length:219 start_codon:yes stop_codon:yes gene_type:complete
MKIELSKIEKRTYTGTIDDNYQFQCVVMYSDGAYIISSLHIDLLDLTVINLDTKLVEKRINKLIKGVISNEK